MNRSGALLDTGPIVALLSRHDSQHAKAERLFAECEPPLRSCEAVLAEACFLMRKIHANGPGEVIVLGRKGVYDVAFDVGEHWSNLEAILQKYKNRPISLADACLIRCAEIFDEPRILTFDADFRIYRWKRNKRFQIL
jgi:predicted nucleic acid-binding protein